MKNILAIAILLLLDFLLFKGTQCLKCRTGTLQSDEQFQKIMQICESRVLGYNRRGGNGRNNYNGRGTDSDESSDSDEDDDMFDNKFLQSNSGSNNRNRNNNNDRFGNGANRNRNDYNSRNYSSSSRNSNGGNNRNWRSTSYFAASANNNYERQPYDNNDNNRNTNSRRNMRNDRNRDRNNDYDDNRDSNSNNRNNNGRNGNGNNRYNNNNNNNNNRGNNNGDNDYDDDDAGYYSNDGEREKACVVQCFFSELNLVDHRGFPMRLAVTSIMSQHIIDPELRDFIEESIRECYHFLYTNSRQEKCQFSQNLLRCLSEKGNERCEDWKDS